VKKSTLLLIAIIVIIIASSLTYYSIKNETPLVSKPVTNWSQYVKTNTKTISLPNGNKSELLFFDSLLLNKKIFMLGESAHGIEEYSSIKLRIIKYLHEHLNFNTIVFESGIEECALINELRDSLIPIEMLRQGVFPIWQTTTNVDLMTYIKKNNIKIFGIDNQYSTDYHSKYLKIQIAKIDINLEKKIYEFDTLFYNYCYRVNFKIGNSSSQKKHMLSMLKEADRACSNLNKKIDLLLQDNQKTKLNESENFKTLKIILRNKKYLWHSYLKTTEYFSDRDSIMTTNFKFIIDSIIPQEKVIFWAHNSHISKTGIQNPSSYLGKKLNNIYGKKIYNVGLYSYQGELMDIQRKKIKISKPSENSLEDILTVNKFVSFTPQKFGYFINLNNVKVTKENSWMNIPLKSFAWGDFETIITPKNEYDGIILINEASCPLYIK
jgi:erythromycin esterase